MTEDDAPLRPYVTALRTHALLVAACVVVGIAAGAYSATTRDREYTASAQLLVTPAADNDRDVLGLPVLRDVGDDARTMQTAAALVDTVEIAEVAAETLGGDLSPRQVRSRVSIDPRGQSNILDVVARGPSPAAAAGLADSYAAAVIDVRSRNLADELAGAIAAAEDQLATPGLSIVAQADLENRVNRLRALENRPDPTVSLVQQAGDADPIGASTPVILLLTGLAGAAAGVLAANVVDAVSGFRRVMSDADVTSLVPAPVLARLPASEHVGRITELPVSSAIDDLSVRIALDPKRRVFMLTGSATGVGTTECAVELAVGLARTGRSVVLVEAGGSGVQVGDLLGIDRGDDDVWSDADDGDLEKSLVAVPGVPGLQVLMGDVDPLPEHAGEVARLLGPALDWARGQADHVIIDAAPIGESLEVVGAAPAVDEVVVVSEIGRTQPSDLQRVANRLLLAGSPPAGHVIVERRRRLRRRR